MTGSARCVSYVGRKWVYPLSEDGQLQQPAALVSGVGVAPSRAAAVSSEIAARAVGAGRWHNCRKDLYPTVADLSCTATAQSFYNSLPVGS